MIYLDEGVKEGKVEGKRAESNKQKETGYTKTVTNSITNGIY